MQKLLIIFINCIYFNLCICQVKEEKNLDYNVTVNFNTSDFKILNYSTFFTTEMKNYLVEVRYNYEWIGNYSVYCAPKFEFNKKTNLIFKPLLGLNFGKHEGFNIDLQLEMDLKIFDFATGHQYTRDFNGKNWYYFDYLQARYKISNKCKIGLVTRTYYENNLKIIIDNGLTVSYRFTEKRSRFNESIK